jgi:ATP-dependent Lon protease
VVIFATSNSTERLSKPLLSRFTVFEIPEYTYPEFEAISVRIIKKLNRNAIIQIASSVWKTGSRDIRNVLKIAKLCNPMDAEEYICRLISIHQKYRKNWQRMQLITIIAKTMSYNYYNKQNYRGHRWKRQEEPNETKVGKQKGLI